MKTRTFLLAALALALLPVSARQSLPDSSTPAWIQEFNNLPETTRKSYIAQFRKAEQLFAQKRIMECLFSLMELEKLYAGHYVGKYLAYTVGERTSARYHYAFDFVSRAFFYAGKAFVQTETNAFDDCAVDVRTSVDVRETED